MFISYCYALFLFFVCSFCLNYLHPYCFCLFNSLELFYLLSLTPKNTRLGSNHAPSCVLPKGVICVTYFSRFGYIGWKPGRKFRSRIRMDGSAVCTRDTTPRTKTGLSVDPHLYHVWLALLLSILIA